VRALSHPFNDRVRLGSLALLNRLQRVGANLLEAQIIPLNGVIGDALLLHSPRRIDA
jgi:hypothetical protein